MLLEIPPRIPKWVRIARSFTGLRTLPGQCALFVGGCLESCGLPSTNSIKARSYLDYGKELKRPRKGCLVVLWRKEPDSTLGHIGFYLKSTPEKQIVLLGSHQGMISIKTFSKQRVLAYRWPITRDNNGTSLAHNCQKIYWTKRSSR
jgi:uncharacterized protein (TIGR02594 family)